MENAINSKGSQKKPNIKMIGIALAVVVLIILAAVIISSSKKGVDTNIAPTNEQGTTTSETTTENVPSAVTTTTATGQVIPVGAHVEVVGASPVKDNVVVTQAGTVAKNDVVPMSPDAPQQTAPITKAQLNNSALKLDVSAAGFSPKEISVKAGAIVTLSVTSVDTNTHVFMFDDNALAAVAIGVGPSETRAITFNAPTKAGEYTFRCDVPGHSGRGETGKMIVK